MCFQPVFAPSAVGNERDTKVIGILHLLKNDFLHRFFLLRNDVKVKFVVHLEYHFALQFKVLETLVNAYHSHLNDVCRRPLYRGVDGIALGEVANYGILRVDVG